jgi:hypothetical protein
MSLHSHCPVKALALHLSHVLTALTATRDGNEDRGAHPDDALVLL